MMKIGKRKKSVEVVPAEIPVVPNAPVEPAPAPTEPVPA